MSLRDKVQGKINKDSSIQEPLPEKPAAGKKSRRKKEQKAVSEPKKPEKRIFRKELTEEEKKKVIDKAIKGKRDSEYDVPTVTGRQIRIRNFFTFIRIILPPVLLIVFLTQVVLLGIVPSKSMVPTLNENDLIVANRLSYVRNPIKRGDVIVFIRNRMFLVKRVIGLPGDTVELNGGLVYVNGTLLDESYVPEGVFTLPLSDGNNQSEFTVPDGKLLVFGDNRPYSADSRFWTDSQGGPLPYVTIKNVKGKVVLSFSFTNGVRLFHDPVYEETTGLFEEKETTEELSQQLHPEEETENSVILETLPVSEISETAESASEYVPETLPISVIDVQEEPSVEETETLPTQEQ